MRQSKEQFNDSDAEKVLLEEREKFRCIIYLPVIDKLCTQSFHAMYTKVQHIFGSLVHYDHKPNG